MTCMREEKYLRMTARVLSAVFTPFYFPTVGFLALLMCTYLRLLPASFQLTLLGTVYAFTVLIPMVGIYLYRKINGWSLRHLGHKEKRVVPYAMTIAAYAACLLLMYRLRIPRYLSGIIVASLMALMICAVVNIWWKISAHMTAVGELVGGLLALSFLFFYNPVKWLCAFLLLAGMLGTSRMVLRQHTLAEVLAGFLVGLVCSVTGILFL